MPQWADLYHFAQLAEDLQIGLWACPETSPAWTSNCIQEAVLNVTKDTHTKALVSKNAASFGEVARKSVGRDIAAREIARLAGSGHA